MSHHLQIISINQTFRSAKLFSSTLTLNNAGFLVSQGGGEVVSESFNFHPSSTNNISYENLHLQLTFESEATEAHSLASGGFGCDRGQNEKNLRRKS